MMDIIRAISIPVKTRGIGLDTRRGNQYKYEPYQKNLAMFVNSKSDGEVVIEMLKELLGARIGSYLDYREHEPNWIQIKLFEADGIDIETIDKNCSELNWGNLLLNTSANRYLSPMNEILTCDKCKQEFNPGEIEPHLVSGPLRWVCNNCYTENYKNELPDMRG